MNTADVALEKFRDIVKDFPDLSEADTKAKIIERIFKEVLDWPEEDITREENIESGYLDYSFKTGTIEHFILEAKKNSIDFTIPEDKPNRHYKLNGVLVQNKDVDAAITQVQRYCSDKGVPYAVVSNGTQYIIFEAIKRGSPWRSGTCLVFRSLDDISNNFGMFWKVLNKQAVQKGELTKTFSDKSKLNFARPLTTIHSKDAELIRNYLSPYIQPFSDYAFEDIVDESRLDMLEQCYVFTKSFGACDEELKTYFVDRLPYYQYEQGITDVAENKDHAGYFQGHFSRCEEAMRKDPDMGHLALLLGGIGSGKTTFIHRFFNVIMKDKKKLLWIYVDFKNAPIDPLRIEGYIYEAIADQLSKKYPKILPQLAKNGITEIPPDSKKIKTAIAVLKYVEQYSIALAIDNVDQHLDTTNMFQETVFLTAKNMVADLKIIALLALREESYFKSMQTGAFNAYHIRKFHVASPFFNRLIEHRLDYVLKLLELPDAELRGRLRTTVDIGPQKADLKDFFTIIRQSITPEKRDGHTKYKVIATFMTEIAAGNMRYALEQFKQFIGSGNTKAEEILGKYRESGTYIIAPHQLIKSVALGNRRYYSENKSYIVNVFDVNTDVNDSHFLHLRLLKYLKQNQDNNAGVGRGYVKIDLIKQLGEQVQISVSGIDDSLYKLAEKGLVEFDTQSPKIQEASFVRITSKGLYYLYNLTKSFTYLDIVWIDTPISEKATFDVLRAKTDIMLLDERLKRVELFLDYLSKAEETEFKNNPEYLSNQLTQTKFMPEISSECKAEMKFIQTKITKPEQINNSA